MSMVHLGLAYRDEGQLPRRRGVSAGDGLGPQNADSRLCREMIASGGRNPPPSGADAAPGSAVAARPSQARYLSRPEGMRGDQRGAVDDLIAFARSAGALGAAGAHADDDRRQNIRHREPYAGPAHGASVATRGIPAQPSPGAGAHYSASHQQRWRREWSSGSQRASPEPPRPNC